MSITTKIEKPLEPGFVQLNATEKSGYTRYYKVPQTNAKKLATDLKKQNKTLSRISDITFAISIIAGVMGTSIFTKKMESGMKKFIIQTLGGIGLATATSYGFSYYAEDKQKALLHKNKAHEIYYKA